MGLSVLMLYVVRRPWWAFTGTRSSGRGREVSGSSFASRLLIIDQLDQAGLQTVETRPPVANKSLKVMKLLADLLLSPFVRLPPLLSAQRFPPFRCRFPLRTARRQQPACFHPVLRFSSPFTSPLQWLHEKPVGDARHPYIRPGAAISE